MPSSSPPSKRARLSGTDLSKNPLHDLYQVIYNVNGGNPEITRYVYHSFLNSNGDHLKIKLYALVETEGGDDSKNRENVALWKGYVRLSDVRGSFARCFSTADISMSRWNDRQTRVLSQVAFLPGKCTYREIRASLAIRRVEN